MAFASFSAGLSGLNANASYLAVIGNNLANINTIGFKGSQVTFMDLVSQTLASSGQNPVQIGLGVVTGAISPVFSQGSIESTREASNVAIQGNGMFVISDGNGGQFYTRAGGFSFDSAGRMVTATGSRVQGYTQIDPATGLPITTGAPTDIQFPPGVLQAPVATTQFQTVTNLDAGAVVGAAFTTSAQVFDSLGTPHISTITYTNTAPGAWTYDITVPGAEVTGGTAGTPFSVNNGTLTFGPGGLLTQVNGAAAADVAFVTPTWTNGASASNLTWDIVDANNIAYLTGFQTASSTSSISQNGSAAARTDSITISSDGTILAQLGAGQSVAVGQLALATFNNPKGLTKLGSNLFGSSASAGLQNVGVPGTGGRGTLIGSALEQSNVDIAQEFTQMILAQRGYQANSRSITTSDELLVETLNLKR